MLNQNAIDSVGRRVSAFACALMFAFFPPLLSVSIYAQDEQAATVASEAAVDDKSETQPSAKPQHRVLIHRRFLRLPVSEQATNQSLTLSVDGKTVEQLEAGFSSTPTGWLTVDVQDWIGATVIIQAADASQLFDRVGQTNRDPNSRANAEPVVKAAEDVVNGGEAPISFAHQILPLISEKCFACHGPDAETAANGLKLNERETAVDMEAVVPGDAAASQIIERMLSDDPGEGGVMPPASSHKDPLMVEQVALISKWIDQGAKYESHWSFTELGGARVPQVEALPLFEIRNPIDAFVLKKLKQRSLEPSPEELPHRLIRRLAFDLTGLPPTPDQVQRYRDDPADAVYAAIVDELLASQHYGEHWTRHWLDAIRYADTHGIHYDNYRSIWPYRDWVINAFNDNMPFDVFTIDQLAGDLRHEPTIKQKVATGYCRCLPTTNEGGSIKEEVAVNYANDQTATTFGVWQGLTVGCAACHDHKFDPISQCDYYALTAYFRNNEMKPMDQNIALPGPYVSAPNEAQAARETDLEARQKTLQPQVAELSKAWQQKWGAAAIADQLQEIKQSSPAELSEASGEPAQTPVTLVSTTTSIESQSPESGPVFSYTMSADAVKNAPVVDGLFGPISQLSKQHGLALEVDFNADLERGFAFGGWFMATDNARGVLWSKRYAESVKSGSGGWEVQLFENLFRLRLFSQIDNGAVEVEVKQDITDGKWHHLYICYDPQLGLRPINIFLDHQQIPYKFMGNSNRKFPSAATLTNDARLMFARRDTSIKNGKVGGFDRDSLSVADFHFFDRPALPSDFHNRSIDSSLAAIQKFPLQAILETVAEVPEPELPAKQADREPSDAKEASDKAAEANDAKAAKAAADKLAKEKEQKQKQLRERLQHLREVRLDLIESSLQWVTDRDLYRLSNDLADAIAELAMQKQDTPKTLVMVEKKDSQPFAHVLSRGDYALKEDRVDAGVPGVLPELKESAPNNRMGLATWIVSPENPLTARVTVNRYWHYLFGAGIVETTDDFGVTGSPPSHPALLDWLAAEFVDHDWDLKHMLRTIVVSSTYRQSQRFTPESLQADPTNRWLSRGPRVRLDGEQLRDMALANAGLLVDKIGGPPVRPYQPEKVWQDVAMPGSDTRFYRAEDGGNLYRRSLYTFWKRTAAPPTMTIMNAPDRDVFCARRELTNTPLQAFVMWNDPQFVEAARKTAEQLLADDNGGRDFAGLANQVGQLFLARDFSDEENKLLKQTWEFANKQFTEHPGKADDLLSVGESPIESSAPKSELAAWTLVVSQAMNLDEALNR